MSYCRFQNTLEDLKDCFEHITDTEISEEEEKARKKLIEVCRDVIEAVGEEEN